jgi:hypothetical protein
MRDRIQPLDALLAAGRPVALVARPGGVTHLYAGPLTSSGAVPHRYSPVCGTHPRRLRDRSANPVRGELRVCLQCSARLTTAPPAVRAEHTSPAALSIADDRRRYAALTVVDIYLSVRFAATEAELDECSLALQLGFTDAEQVAEYQSPTGRTFSDLPRLINQQRDRITPRTPFNPAAPDLSNSDYWEALRTAEVTRARVPRHRRQNVSLRTA